MKRMKQTHPPKNDNVVTGTVKLGRRTGHNPQRPVRFASGKNYNRKDGKHVPHD